MTDKELKRMSRAQLIDFICQLQLKQDELIAENERLSKALADKIPSESKAGNVAEGAFEIQNVMQTAQDAAAYYLEEIRNIRSETEEKCRLFLEKVQKEADDIIAQANGGTLSADSRLEEMEKEFDQNQ